LSAGLLTTAGDAAPILASMDRAAQLRQLPLVHAIALRMHEAGADDALIAVALAIEPESVGPLLALASAKAERIARGGGGSSPSASRQSTQNS
jgi:hypothetical protein